MTRAAELVAEMGGYVDHQAWEKIDSLHQHSNVYTKDLSPRQIAAYRYRCLAHFTSRRMLRMLRQQRGAFVTNLARYLVHGARDGIGMQYAIGYFMVSGGDNVVS
jgi:hypothetical protein